MLEVDRHSAVQRTDAQGRCLVDRLSRLRVLRRQLCAAGLEGNEDR